MATPLPCRLRPGHPHSEQIGAVALHTSADRLFHQIAHLWRREAHAVQQTAGFENAQLQCFEARSMALPESRRV